MIGFLTMPTMGFKLQLSMAETYSKAHCTSFNSIIIPNPIPFHDYAAVVVCSVSPVMIVPHILLQQSRILDKIVRPVSRTGINISEVPSAPSIMRPRSSFHGPRAAGRKWVCHCLSLPQLNVRMRSRYLCKYPSESETPRKLVIDRHRGEELMVGGGWLGTQHFVES